MARELTITLDDDVAATLDEEARRTGTSLDEIVGAAVRHRPRPERPRFEVKPFSLGTPRINIDCTAAALEFEEAAEQE